MNTKFSAFSWRNVVYPSAGLLLGGALGAGIPYLFLSEENKRKGSLIGALLGGFLGGLGGYFVSTIPTAQEIAEAQQLAANIAHQKAIEENNRRNKHHAIPEFSESYANESSWPYS